MENKILERKLLISFSFLLALSFFMMFSMNITAEAATYKCSPDSFLVEDGSSGMPTPVNDPKAVYDTSTHTLTLAGADLNGTLDFSGTSNADTENQEITYFNIVLQAGTTSTIGSLKLNSAVIVTVKGEGKLVISAKNEAEQETGANLEFQQDCKTLEPRLIIAGGTVNIGEENNSYGYAIKEEGSLYIREGAKEVTVSRGKTGLCLEDNKYGIPKIFSDYPCLAKYTDSYNGGAESILAPNGTYNGSSDKEYTESSLIGDSSNYQTLTFRPGHTATWKNDDGTVLETDEGYYWDGQVPEYNGETPTKAEDAQYTYTFAGWSEPIEALYEDKTYIAAYSATTKQYTITYDANGHGTAPKSQTVDYGTVISKPTDPSEVGWAFGGWFTDVSCTNAYDFSSPITGNLTVYAKWTEVQIEYDQVKPDAGKVQDITESDKVFDESNPFGAKIQNSSELKNLLSLTDDEIAKGVNVWLEVKDASSSVSEADKSKVFNAANGYTIGMYLDINLFKKVGSDDATKVSETNGKIKVSFVVPENMRKSGRTYEIVRVHNGVATVITGTYDEKTHVLTFETDGFSTYALTYKDAVSTASTTNTANTVSTTKTVTKSPKTTETENTMMWYTLFLVSCVGLYVSGVSKKRK